MKTSDTLLSLPMNHCCFHSSVFKEVETISPDSSFVAQVQSYAQLTSSLGKWDKCNIIASEQPTTASRWFLLPRLSARTISPQNGLRQSPIHSHNTHAIFFEFMQIIRITLHIYNMTSFNFSSYLSKNKTQEVSAVESCSQLAYAYNFYYSFTLSSQEIVDRVAVSCAVPILSQEFLQTGGAAALQGCLYSCRKVTTSIH